MTNQRYASVVTFHESAKPLLIALLTAMVETRKKTELDDTIIISTVFTLLEKLSEADKSVELMINAGCELWLELHAKRK